MKRISRKVTAPQVKNAGLLSPITTSGQPYTQPWDRRRGISRGRDRETIVAAITQAIASDVSNVDELPIVATALGTGENVTESSHYCYALNVAATTAMSAQVLRQHIANSINFAGECYLLEVNKTLTPLVGGSVEIFSGGKNALDLDGAPLIVAGYRVKADDGSVRGLYDSNGKAAGDGAIIGSVLHRVYIPHPENPLRANPPIAAAALPVEVLHLQRQATKSILVNDGVPAGVLSIETPVDGAELGQDEIDDAERRINSKLSNPDRKGRVLVLNASATYQPLGDSALRDGWVTVAENARREILAVWRAPESALGIGGGRTYENQRVELAAYYSATVLPILNLVCATLNLSARRIGYVLRVDTSNVTALNESLDGIADRAVALLNSGLVTVNEARNLLGLEPVDGGDELVTPVEADPALDQEREALPFVERAATPGVNPDRFSAALDRATADHEQALAEYAQRFHARMLRMVSGALKRRTKAAGDEPVSPIDVSNIVDQAARGQELADDLGPMLFEAAAEVGTTVAAEMAVELGDDVRDVWKSIATTRVQRLVAGTSTYSGWTQQLVDDVQSAITAAYENGESVDGAIARVAEALDVAGEDASKIGARAERIARTELSGLMNEVSYTQMEESGVVTGKQWYSIGDGRTRSSHQAVNGMKVGFNEKFSVNGLLADGPHDPSLPASELVNCRCRLIPIVD